MRPAQPISFGTLALLAACSNNDAVSCTAQFVPAVVVEVRDSVTQVPLAGARGIVQDGTFIDSLRPSGGSTLQAAGERPGTYRVAVGHAGYADWVVTGVRVQRDICHVVTVTLQAALQPAP